MPYEKLKSESRHGKKQTGRNAYKSKGCRNCIDCGRCCISGTIVSMASGEQAQPGALGKGIGLIVGGAVLCVLKAIVTVLLFSR